MSNRLECEFPAHRWQAVPLIRRDPALSDVAEQHMARGRELRSAAVRRSARTVVAALAHAPAQVVAFLRCSAYGIVKGAAPEHDCRGASPRGA